MQNHTDKMFKSVFLMFLSEIDVHGCSAAWMNSVTMRSLYVRFV